MGDTARFAKDLYTIKMYQTIMPTTGISGRINPGLRTIQFPLSIILQAKVDDFGVRYTATCKGNALISHQLSTAWGVELTRRNLCS